MWVSLRQLCGILLLSCQAVSFPLIDATGDDANDDGFTYYNETLVPPGEPRDIFSKRQSKSPELRILPLGASIVYGVGSSNGNGFRKPLRDALRNQGFPVNMVGTRRGGTMKDNDNEATPGAIVSEINTYLKRSLPYKPNVVIINGGTNDCNRQVDVNNIGSRMNSVLNTIWGAPDMSRTCVFLSTLLPTSGVGEGHRLNANQQYRNLVSQRASEGKCIYLADVDPPSPSPANSWIALGRDMNSDNIHPKTSQVCINLVSAIIKAADDSKIKQAAKINTTNKGVGCRKEASGDIYSNGLTQAGWGLEDGIYSHESEGMGEVLSILADRDVGQLFFARLFHSDRDDFLEWFEKEPGVHWYGVWKNNGNGNFQKIGDLNPDLFCNPAGVQFIDMNADGLDDLVCINGEGTAYLSINKGDGSGTRPPTFKRISSDAKIKDSEGFPQSQVTMGDIDGDGRGDYLWLDNGGNVWAARNGWVEDKPKYWQNLGLRFEAKGMGDVKGVRFEDINGDGRDDWLWVGNKGETYTWTNARSCASGRDGNGLNVTWRQAVNPVGTSGGPTHFGMADLGDSDLNRDRIYFARIYGEQSSWGQLAKQDYIYIRHSKEGSKHRFKLNVWNNKGIGGTKLLADGNKYCNMMGHSDGRMDYVWTLSTGAMTLFPNAGRTDMSSGGSFWEAKVDPMWEPQKWTGKNADRRDLHLVDWDGDGTCDIVWTDPENNNRPQVWINKFPKTGRWEWDYLSNPAPQVQCNERRGIALQDLAVQFATLEGKRADYLCLKKDGTITGWIHRDDGSWEDAGQIKFAEDRDRANLRFADVDGDGADDLIWIDKFNGDGVVSYNMGRGNRADLAGSLFFWEMVSSPSYKGSVAGTCMHYPDLDGNGRADRHEIQGTFNNQAKTYFNPSCSLTDATGDDGSVSDPGLPKIPGDGNNNGGGGDDGGSGGNDDLPDNDDPEDDDGVDPICDKTWKDLHDLLDHTNEISPVCGPEYILEHVQNSFQASFKRFNEILDDGYDGYFNTYARFLVDSGSSNLDSFMRGEGDKYFDCEVRELNPCCTACNLPDYGTCNNCIKECNIQSPYDKLERWVDTKLTCPPNFSGWGNGRHRDKTIHWKMNKNKEDDFWAELVATTVAPKFKMPVKELQQQYNYFLDSACSREYASVGGDITKLSKSCYNEGFWYDAPQLEGYKTSDVVNPKETVQKIIKDSDEMLLGIASILLAIKAEAYLDEFPSDVVDAVTYPALQVEQAVSRMEDVVKIAKEINDANAKEYMFAFLSAFLAILPMAGGPLAQIGMSALGRSIVYFAEAGNAALAMYSVVSTPESAPLTVFFWLVSARSVMSATNMRNAAKARRNMSEQDLAVFSNIIAQRLAKVDLISKRQGQQAVLWQL